MLDAIYQYNKRLLLSKIILYSKQSQQKTEAEVKVE